MRKPMTSVAGGVDEQMTHRGAKTIAIEGLFDGVTQPFDWQFAKVLHQLAVVLHCKVLHDNFFPT
jgi:hypothetical protein